MRGRQWWISVTLIYFNVFFMRLASQCLSVTASYFPIHQTSRPGFNGISNLGLFLRAVMDAVRGTTASLGRRITQLRADWAEVSWRGSAPRYLRAPTLSSTRAAAVNALFTPHGCCAPTPLFNSCSTSEIHQSRLDGRREVESNTQSLQESSSIYLSAVLKYDLIGLA